MSFDTALLNLVGAGLGVVGSRYLSVSERVIRQTAPADFVAFLSREGFGRHLAPLAQDVARGLVEHYRADPDRVVRHIQLTAALLPNHGFSVDAEAEAVWSELKRPQPRGQGSAGTGTTHQSDDAPSTALCARLTAAILSHPRKSGMLAKAGLDDDLIEHVLRGVLRPVLRDRAGLTALQPLLEQYALERGQQRAHSVAGGARPPALIARAGQQNRIEASNAIIEQAAARSNVPAAMLSAIAAELIAGSTHDHDLQRRLAVKITEYQELDSWLTRPADFDAAVATLRAQAAAAMAAGRLDLADMLLAQAEDVDLAAARESIETETRHQLQASETRMLRGNLDELRAAYRDAAAHCTIAVGYLPADALRGRWRLTMRQAQLLAREADEHGDTAALDQAVALHQTCLQLRPRHASSKDWAITQHVFGNLHYRLSEHDDDTAGLQRAVQACRAAADELTGQREPMRWAQAMADTALALHRLGERTGDQAALVDALSAQRETLAVFTRSASPQDWAQAQIGIAGTLLMIAIWDGSLHRLTEAIASYRSALDVLGGDHAPEPAFKARVRMAQALCLMARRTGQQHLILEAEAVVSRLPEATSQMAMPGVRAPFELGRLRAVQGTIDLELGRRSRSSERLVRAVDELEEAISLLAANPLPLQVSFAQRDVGAAYEALSQLERFAEPRLAQAVVAYRSAVSEVDRSQHPQLWAHGGLDLARALHHLGLETGAERWLAEAQVVEQSALETLRALGDVSLVAFIEDGIAERNAQIEKLRKTAQGRR